VSPLAHARTDCNVVAGVSPAECRDLVALYNATNGRRWIRSDGWNVTNTPCRWYGVQCRDGHVDLVNLGRNSLRGVLPHLVNLTNLRFMYLYENYLEGSIQWVVHFPDLVFFDVGYNWLSGSIPDISVLTKLRDFVVSYNNFGDTLPSSLGNSGNLEYLCLQCNNFRGRLPESIMKNSKMVRHPGRLSVLGNHLSSDDRDYSDAFLNWLDSLGYDSGLRHPRATLRPPGYCDHRRQGPR